MLSAIVSNCLGFIVAVAILPILLVPICLVWSLIEQELGMLGDKFNINKDYLGWAVIFISVILILFFSI